MIPARTTPKATTHGAPTMIAGSKAKKRTARTIPPANSIISIYAMHVATVPPSGQRASGAQLLCTGYSRVAKVNPTTSG